MIWFVPVFHLLHHFCPTVMLSWHNHFIHIKQRNPVVPVQRRQVQGYASKVIEVIQPDSLIAAGQEENQVKIHVCTTCTLYNSVAALDFLKLHLYMFL